MNAPVVEVAELPVTYMQPAARARWLAMGERNGIRGESDAKPTRGRPSPERSAIGRTAIIRALAAGPLPSVELVPVLAEALKAKPDPKATSAYLATMVEAGALAVVKQVHSRGRVTNVYAATEAGKVRYA